MQIDGRSLDVQRTREGIIKDLWQYSEAASGSFRNCAASSIGGNPKTDISIQFCGKAANNY